MAQFSEQDGQKIEMGFDMSSTTLAWLLATGSVSIFSYLIGGFVYWNQGQDKIKQLEADLEVSYQEQDHLGTLISCDCRSNRNPSAGL